MDIRIIGGVVSKDHIHLHIEYPPKLSVSDIVKRLKGRTSNKLQMEFPHKKRNIGEIISGQLVMEHGVQEI